MHLILIYNNLQTYYVTERIISKKNQWTTQIMPIFGKSRFLHDATSDAIGRIGYAYDRTAYADCMLGKAEMVLLFQVFEKQYIALF